MISKLEKINIQFYFLFFLLLGMILCGILGAIPFVSYYALLGGVIGVVTVGLVYNLNVELLKILLLRFKVLGYMIFYLLKIAFVGGVFVAVVLIDYYSHVAIVSAFEVVSQPINIFSLIAGITVLPAVIFLQHAVHSLARRKENAHENN